MPRTSRASILWGLMCAFLVVHMVAIHAEALNLIASIHRDTNSVTVYPHEEFVEDYLRTDRFIVEYDRDIDLSDLDETIITIPFIMDVIPMV